MADNAVRERGRPGRGPGRSSRLWLRSALAGLTVCFTLLGLRLFQIQILGHERFLAIGLGMWGGTDEIPAVRGDVFSRDDVLLARSVASCEVGIDPSLFADEETLVRAVRIVCDGLGYAAERRRRRLEKALSRRRSGRRYARLGRAVEWETARDIHRTLSVELSPAEARAFCRIPSSHRVYPRGAFASQITGVTTRDGRGVEGVERTLDRFLAERDGKRLVVRDAEQRLRVYYPENRDVSPIDGYRLVLTIDSRIQRILEEELDRGVRENSAEAGVGVVMDCGSGDVLAMASWPDYDPNEYHSYPAVERDRRRKNRVIENVYEPGSVLKPFIACWALRSGLTWRREPIWKGGSYHRFRVGRSGRTVTDVRDHGPLRMEGVVVHSSNIGMSFLGLRLGRDRIREALDAFGFGRRTGIRLPGEAPGWRQRPERWSELYTSISVSFGYEIMVTPIQLCAAFSALVNGGHLYRPRIVESLAGGGVELMEPVVETGRPIDEELSREMREILLRVVTEGTGRHLAIDGLRFGGKSGTADMDPLYSKTDYLASFEAFAPYEDPRIVVLVMIEKPKSGSIYGSTVAGPVVAAVLRRHFRAATAVD